MSSVELRPTQDGDVPAMLALVAACDETYRAWAPAGWEPPPPEAARWVSELGAPDRWTRVAVEPDGRVVGFVSWGTARDEGPLEQPLVGVAHVGALFVHPDRWRRGIGERLLGAAVEAMRAAGYAHAQLNTPDGSPAERFYRALGWERDGRDGFHRVVGLMTVGYAREL